MKRAGRYLVAAVASPFVAVGAVLAIGFGLAMILFWDDEE